MSHLASIIHVTDLHLFVDATGARRPPSEMNRAVRLLRRWPRMRSLASAEDQPLQQMRQLLPRLVEQEARLGGPVVVAQTGDVEAYGSTSLSGGLPGVDFLYKTVWPALRDRGAVCVDVFGNHDVWTGRLLSSDAALRHRPEFAGPWATPIVLQSQATSVIVHRVNTVSFGILGLLAWGSFEPFPSVGRLRRLLPSFLSRESALETLNGSIGERTGVHLVLCHHPVRKLNGLRVKHRITLGVLLGRRVLQRALNNRVALVLTGHHHRYSDATGFVLAGTPTNVLTGCASAP